MRVPSELQQRAEGNFTCKGSMRSLNGDAARIDRSQEKNSCTCLPVFGVRMNGSYLMDSFVLTLILRRQCHDSLIIWFQTKMLSSSKRSCDNITR